MIHKQQEQKFNDESEPLPSTLYFQAHIDLHEEKKKRLK
jgi:hypothetical protein